MKNIMMVLMGLIFCQGPALAQLRDIDLGATISDGRLRSFYLAICEHYRIPARQVVEIRNRQRILDDELPVVFFLAARARIQPSAIIDLRIKNMSWFDIGLHYGLTADIFYVNVGAERIGPPYGNAYGYYRKYGPSKNWKKFRLTDREVIDLVNLRFMSEYHNRTPEEIIGMRGRQSGFVAINDEIQKAKQKETPDKGKPNPAARGNPVKGNQNPAAKENSDRGNQGQSSQGNSKKTK